MSIERKTAGASLLWTFAVGLLLWARSQTDFPWPPVIVDAAFVLGGAGLLVTIVLWCHIGWLWIRSKGLQLLPAITIAIGLALTLGGAIWGVATWAPNLLAGAPQPNQLTAQLFADPQSQDTKSYYAAWGNQIDPLNILYGFFGPTPPNEESVSIFITNIGPGDIRRIKIKWALQSEPILNLIASSGLFRSRITQLSPHAIQFAIKRPDGGTNSGVKVFSLSGENEIPIIPDGRTQQALMPKPMTTALWLNALCVSRLINEKALEYNRRTRRIASLETGRMPRITLTVSYENQSGKSAQQTFAIDGLVFHGNAVSDGTKGQSLNDPEGSIANVRLTSIVSLP